jgi:hypothetical protein
MSAEYQRAIRSNLPNAELCFDPVRVGLSSGRLGGLNSKICLHQPPRLL